MESKKSFTPPIPEYACESGECSGMGCVGDFYDFKELRIPNLDPSPLYFTVVRGTLEDRLVYLGPKHIDACLDLANDNE